MEFIELTGHTGKRAMVNVAAIFAVIASDTGGCTVYGAGDGVACRVKESYEQMRDLLAQVGVQTVGGGNGDGQ